MIIEIQESAKKDLKKIDKSSALKLLQSMEKLKEYPNISNIKKLKEFYPPYRDKLSDLSII